MGGILQAARRSTATRPRAELAGPPNPIVQAQMAELRKKGAALGGSRPGADGGARGAGATSASRSPSAGTGRRAAPPSTSRARPSASTRAQWSKWVPLEFRVNFLVRLYGHGAVLPGARRRANCSSTSRRSTGGPTPPRDARSPRPTGLPKSLYERLGTYRTLGWAEATWPLNEDRIDEKAFMDDLYRAFDDRAQVILHRHRREAVGPARRRHRVDRPRPAHDVALHRPDPPDVRRGGRREVRRLDRARLQAVRQARRRGPAADRAGHAGLRAVRPRLPLVRTA